MIRACIAVLLASWACASAHAQSPESLSAEGYTRLACVFTERCRLGLPCEAALLEITWYYRDERGTAYRDLGGRLEPGILMRDQDRLGSVARAIVMPMRQGSAGHLTNFFTGGAIYSMQYEGGPASGQFLRGDCTSTELLG